MAIVSRCNECKNEFSINLKTCPKCKTPMTPGNRKYKIIIRRGGVKRSKVVDNLALAREIEITLLNDIIRENFSLLRKKTVPTLSRFWTDQYLPWLKTRKKSWHADEIYFGKHIGPALGDKPLDKISPLDVERMLSGLKKGLSPRGKPYAAQTIKHQLVLLSRILTIAIQWGKYPGPNPCTKVKPPKINNQVTGHLTPDETTRLLAVLDSYHDRQAAGLVKLALLSGLRRSELFRLTWADVDLSRSLVALKNPKGGKDAVLPLSAAAVELLKSLPRDADYIFPNPAGGMRTTINRPWANIKEAAALPDDFRFHDLRHHFASHLVSNGVSLYAVQALLNHKTPAMTARYSHLSGDALRDAVNKGAAVMTARKPSGLKVVKNGG